jgi:hypothetical protein
LTIGYLLSFFPELSLSENKNWFQKNYAQTKSIMRKKIIFFPKYTGGVCIEYKFISGEK